MKKITIMLVFAVFATMFMVGCGGDDASAEFTKKQQEISKEMESKPLFERDPRSDLLIKEGTPEELMHKYGPLDMTQAEIDKLVASIKWESNPNPSVLGSPKAKKGGTFVYGMTGYPATIRTEGENSSYVFNTILSGLVYESMTGLDSITLKTTPGLANKWSIGEDKRTYFFHVDPEAKWIDGKPVTSYDYVSSWDLLTSEGLKTPFTMDYWNKYERPVALTPSIVMIRAKNVEWRLFMSAGGLTVYPEHIIGRITPEEYMTEYHTKMMPGTGPYVFDEARTNEYITMRRNDNYWAKNKPYMVGTNNFETIRYIFHTDEAILLEKFKAGEMDFTIINMARRWVQEYTADSWDAIKKNHVVRQRVFNQAPTGMSGFAFNMRRKPFDDVRVRKAIAHLFNREKMMDTLFFNEYVFMDSYFPNSPYENPDNPKLRYDPEEAILLLEEAGWSQANMNSEGYMVKDGEVFELTLNYFGDNRVETIFQEELKHVGIKLNLRQVDWPRHLKDLHERNFRIATIGYTGLLFPNPESSYHSKFADRDNTNNIWGFKNDRVDELSEAYNVEFDVTKRIEMVREVDSLLMAEYMTTLKWYSNNMRILYWNKFGKPDFVMPRFTSSSYADGAIISYWWYDDAKVKALEDGIKTGKTLPAEPAEINYWEDYD